MSLSLILDPSTQNQNWKNLYVYSLNSLVPISQPVYWIDAQNAFAQFIPSGSVQTPIQFPSNNRVGFDAPTVSSTVFTNNNKAGFYLVNYQINFQNTIGPLVAIDFSTWIRRNGADTYATNQITIDLNSNKQLTLTGSAFVFMSIGDYIEIIASQSSVQPMATSNSLLENSRNKVQIHYLHN